MAVPAAGGVDLSRKFVSETVIEEKRKQIQEEWEKVRKPEDPEEAPEEEYDGRSLFERLQEQKDKKQEEYDEQFKFRSHSALKKLASSESRKEPERRVGPRPAEVKTSHLSQAHLLAGAVKRRSSSQSSDNSKKHKVEESAAWNGGQTEQEAGGDAGEQTSTVKTTGILHRPSAAVCVGILPGLGAYSGSSDSESSSDSEV
ncbi:PSME3-interacting protein isoform X4 [Salmo salar]|uniref:PSME3-interacting protein isoform X4 n=1 Tax=Salmo salar TaxID=8030 RepID=A0A1S3MMZ2_SALSA|nr:PSME3-interacting protein isoform X4 [Salmo salar]|eukprot:XP_014004494.1 PREDICTED: protein FAM192A isoform X4 [Salmo salar]